MRASDLQQAFIIAGQATLRGFGVERYATSGPQLGAIYEGGPTGHSTFQNLVVSDNALIGINLSQSGNVIDHVTADRNGMSGIEIGTGGPVISDETIQYSELDGNNTHHYNAAPSSAGIKVGTVNGLVIRGNNVQNNLRINGIWTDQNVTNFTIVNNVVTSDGTRGRDSTAGIANELSGTGIVAGNVVSGFQEGITMFDTANVKIMNNNLSNNSTWDIGLTQDDRYKPGLSYEPASIQPSASDPWLIENETIENNVFADSTGGLFQFYVLDKSTERAASSMNLDVEGNLFTHKDTNSEPIMVGWGGADNTTVTQYETPSDFAAGVGQSLGQRADPDRHGDERHGPVHLLAGRCGDPVAGRRGGGGRREHRNQAARSVLRRYGFVGGSGGEHCPAARRRAAPAGVDGADLDVVRIVDHQAVVDRQLLARRDRIQRGDDDARTLERRLAVRCAPVVQPARRVTTAATVDHPIVADVEEEGVPERAGFLVPPARLVPGDPLAGVVEQPLAACDGAEGEHPSAMDGRAAHREPTRAHRASPQFCRDDRI